MTEQDILKAVRAKWRTHAVDREGLRTRVYRDSRGKLTVGIGHLVVVRDNLKLGDVISVARVEQLFAQDSQRAIDLAMSQAKQLRKAQDIDFIVALVSVNFQLGDWRIVFRNTYPAMVRGEKDRVIASLQRSAWAKQTPVRVKDFILAMDKAFA